MAHVYSVYGLRVLADGRIPGFMPGTDGADTADVTIRLNRMPPWWENASDADAVWYRSPHAKGLIIRQLEKPGWYHLQYFDGVEFLVHPEAGEIWSRWSSDVTLEDAATYLVGPVFGFILRLRKVCCLHASAVAVGEKILVFCGAPGAGKSTTAAAFGKLGYPVVSDDIVPLLEKDRIFWAPSGYPRLCLWPDAAASLFGSSHALPRITPEGGISGWWNKRYLDLSLDGHRFQRQSLPLAAIYLLHERKAGAGGPVFDAIPAASAVPNLSANTYMNYLPDRRLQAADFQFLSRLVGRVPVRKVVPQMDSAAVTRLCEAILEDYMGQPVPGM